jgi:hypothetical protein
MKNDWRCEDLLETWLAKLRQNPDYQEAKACYVSAYRVAQHYGGCEEGGWWYDRWYLEGSVCFPTREEAEAYLAATREEVEKEQAEIERQRWIRTANLPDIETAYHDEGYIPRGWSDGGSLRILIEDKKGEYDNSREPRPRYE